MPPQHIAILGAGPVGLEAALAAVDAGRSFTLYESAPHAAGNVRDWGHVHLFTPWKMNVSPRMCRHLETAGIDVPGGDACPTGNDLAECLLDPLAALTSVAPHMRTGTKVLSVARQGLLKHEEIGSEERARRPFRLVVRDANGSERVDHADVVLDCTGTYGVANALGEGGVPAPGEGAAEAYILRHIPEVDTEPEAWAGKTLLVTGAGHSAQTAICDLVDLAERYPGTRITWALRRAEPTWAIDPDDPLPERCRLTERAAAIAAGASDLVEVLTGVTVDGVERTGEGVVVTLAHADGSRLTRRADLVVSLTGYIGDAGLHRQLQVHECYATSGPMKLAAALLGQGSANCLEQTSHGPDTLTNPEPGFFILGIKSYGRSPGFLMQVGWSQVEEVFSLLGA
jgi:flavin-dependent dehydrogenase